jgi:formylmethanofuran dehydrogenase subunit B
MIVENVVCTGCSLLCDDVDVDVEDPSISKTRGACSHGDARLKGFQKNRLREALVDGYKVDVDEAIDWLAETLKSAKRPLIYGGECSSNATIELALKIAEELGAYYDAPQSICRALLPLQEELGIKGPGLEEVLDEADFVVYWGTSVADTHLRHASRYAVMPRGRVAKMGRESRVVASIDVRESMSMRIAQHKVVIDPCSDVEVAKAIVDLLNGRAPRLRPEVARQLALLASDLKRASFVALFIGSGALKCREGLRAVLELARILSAKCKCSVHSMAENVNSYGQAKVMWRALKTCSPYDFREREPAEPAQVLASRGVVDFVLAINSDVLAQMPLEASKRLKGRVCCTTELKSVTQAYSKVAIPVKILGVEAGGVVTRIDGVEVELKPFIINREVLSEEEVLSRILALI